MLFEIDPVEGVKVGRDVRKMSPDEIQAAGLQRVARGDAIRHKCLDCCGHNSAEVRRCVATSCALWPFRFGTDPFREKRELSDEQREEMRVRLQNARGALRP